MSLTLTVTAYPKGYPYYVFEMGDGSFVNQTENSVLFTYKNPGTYQIVCYAVDRYCRPGPKTTKTVTMSP